MKKAFIYSLLITFILGCSISKEAVIIPQTEEVKTLMATKAFIFSADVVYPLATQSLNAISNAGLFPPGSNAGAIQINGTFNFLRVQGDTVSANLPYYGERRFGGGYGSNTGIEFKGIPSSYHQEFNADKNRFDIAFLISEKMEFYNVNLSVFPNKTASLIVTSNQRNSIRYTGNIDTLEK